MDTKRFFGNENMNTSMSPEDIEAVITQFLMHCIDVWMHDSRSSIFYLKETAVAFEESFIQSYGNHPLTKQLA